MSGIAVGGGVAFGGEIIALRFTTDGSEEVTPSPGNWDGRFSLTDFSSGVATLSWTGGFSVVAGVAGETEADSATPGSRQSLICKGQNYSTKTATVRCVDEVSRAAEAATSITGTLLLLVK